MNELRESYLVQRLQQPSGFDNPFSFGGGLVNGGLSDEAMGLLRGIFSFDYMGSAEFEFGAVPKAFREIASRELTAFTITIPLAKVEPHWKDDNSVPPCGEATVYVLCPSDQRDLIASRIRELAAGKGRQKEATRFPAALRPVDKWDRDTTGWLELDNGFLFFIDRTMWERACGLFGVKVEVAS